MTETETKTKNPLKPYVNLLYNGKDCSADFSKYLNSMSFKEFEDEQSDELMLGLNNNDGYFTDLWYPDKGDKLTCSIDFAGETFDCGTFTIDDNNFEFTTSGDTVEIRALATSINTPVRTQKIKNWSGKTLIQIANEIGKTHGFTVLGDTGNINIGSIVQKNESDLGFLKRIAKFYGYIFNIKDGYLTFIKIEDLHDNDAQFTLSKTDINYLSLNDSATKIYGKCTAQYRDLKTNTIKNCTVSGNTDISDTLYIYQRFNSPEEAQRAAYAGLNGSNKEVRGRIILAKPFKYSPGDETKEIKTLAPFTAGVNFNMTGIGKFEGKYHIKSTERRLDSNGYKVEGEIVKC